MISNEEFNKLYKDKEVKKIIRGVSYKYSKYLVKDDIQSATMEALWKAIETHKEKPHLVFDAILVKQIGWACCRLIKQYNRYNEEITNILQHRPPTASFYTNPNWLEYLDGLDPKTADIVNCRFIDKMTLKEIANKHQCSLQNVFSKINKAVKHIKEQCT